MHRYNGINRNSLVPSGCLIDVTYDVPQYVLTDDIDKPEKEQRKAPLYAFHSIVDKTFFKPGLSSISQLSSAGRKPVYDSLSDGSMPDYGVNVAWVRSPARDRVDIDLALNLVKQSIENAQLEDAETIKQANQATKQLEKLGNMIKSSSSQSKQDETIVSSE